MQVTIIAKLFRSASVDYPSICSKREPAMRYGDLRRAAALCVEVVTFAHLSMSAGVFHRKEQS
jgi:hypothetical protein